MKLNNETKVGILAAVAITLLILGFNLLKGEKIFVSGFELKSYYEEIAGLSTGNPVLYNGFRVGQVKDIDIDEATGQIEVRFSLKKGLEVPYDSKAVIANADLLGSKAIRLERGNEKEIVENGGVLEGVVEKSIDQELSEKVFPMIETVDGLVKNLERFTGWLNNTMDQSAGNKIDDIMDDFVVVSRNFARTSTRVDTLVGTFQATANNANRVVKNFRDQGESINRIMGSAEKFTDSLAAASGSMKAMVEQGSAAVKDLEGILASVQNGEGTLGKLVTNDELYDNINSSTERLDSLLEHFQNSPRVPVDLRIQLGDPERKARKEEEKRKRQLRKAAERAAKKNK